MLDLYVVFKSSSSEEHGCFKVADPFVTSHQIDTLVATKTGERNSFVPWYGTRANNSHEAIEIALDKGF